MADDVGQEDKLAGGAGAGAGAGNLRRRRRGREEDESKLYLLSAPPEVLSVIMLFLEGATLAQASCVSKVGFARKVSHVQRANSTQPFVVCTWKYIVG